MAIPTAFYTKGPKYDLRLIKYLTNADPPEHKFASRIASTSVIDPIMRRFDESLDIVDRIRFFPRSSALGVSDGGISSTP